mmetsp:Transcript_118150/g.280523  ORF Transcript_118150/g.280523 Transcript_118150/m.280523 type:complete len:397 (-) Transcript_118150:20-1210(-)
MPAHRLGTREEHHEAIGAGPRVQVPGHHAHRAAAAGHHVLHDDLVLLLGLPGLGLQEPRARQHLQGGLPFRHPRHLEVALLHGVDAQALLASHKGGTLRGHEDHRDIPRVLQALRDVCGDRRDGSDLGSCGLCATANGAQEKAAVGGLEVELEAPDVVGGPRHVLGGDEAVHVLGDLQRREVGEVDLVEVKHLKEMQHFRVDRGVAKDALLHHQLEDHAHELIRFDLPRVLFLLRGGTQRLRGVEAAPPVGHLLGLRELLALQVPPQVRVAVLHGIVDGKQPKPILPQRRPTFLHQELDHAELPGCGGQMQGRALVIGRRKVHLRAALDQLPEPLHIPGGRVVAHQPREGGLGQRLHIRCLGPRPRLLIRRNHHGARLFSRASQKLAPKFRLKQFA